MNSKRICLLAGSAVLAILLTACTSGSRPSEEVITPSAPESASLQEPASNSDLSESPLLGSKPAQEEPGQLAPVESVEDPPENPAESGSDSEGEEESEGDAEPEAEPEEPPDSPWDVAVLRASLEEELSTCTGQWALYWKCLETGESILLGEQKMVAASLIKLYVAGAYYDALGQGLVSEYPELVHTMISDSSNDACNRLIDLLGGGDTAAGMEYVNQFIASLGFSSTELNRKMLEQSPPENYTSVTDCGRVMEMIVQGEYVSEDASEELLGYLKRQTRTWKIPAGIPSGIETANKTGELTGVENDAAIVWVPPYSYILCIMSEDIRSESAGQYNISTLSRMVYEAFELPSDGPNS